MPVMMLAYEAPEDFAARADSKALETPETASVLTLRNGKRHVEVGPFPDSKEQLGGFFLLDAASLDEAATWASKCPAAKNGYVDIRRSPITDRENRP